MRKPKASTNRVPKYCLHKASGRAVVRLSGTDHYLGPYGTDQSHEAYNRLIAQWLAVRKEKQYLTERSKLNAPLLTVGELLTKYRIFAESYYVYRGRPTKEFVNLKYAMKPLRELYGSTQASDFGPLKLKAMQQHFIGLGICRTQVNRRIDKIRRMFKWAVSEELVPSSVLHGLQSVPGLRYGRTAAKEAPPIQPVEDRWIDATLIAATPHVAAMVQIQRLTGMRPQDVVNMKFCELDRTQQVWQYEREEHKNKWRGQRRVIYLGPKAQEILKTVLSNSEQREHLFSPQCSEDWRNARRREDRTTPLTPSQRARKKKVNPKRSKRSCYDVDSYRRAIKYAIAKANKSRPENDQIPKWCPLQIRHTCATEIRRVAGLEAAQVTLGHSRADVTQIYAERNEQLAIKIALEHG
jgi:integrase